MFAPERIQPSKKVFQVCDHSDKKVIRFKNQDYETLRRDCIRNRKLFEDPYFEAVDKSIFFNQPVPSDVRWARPGEISDKPLFIDGQPSVHDLDQGYLGDCWFIAGCAAIVQVQELFENVVPTGQHIDGREYAGIFHFRFWYYGQWVDVVIDDRLPVRSDNKLLFCSNKQEPNEFWAALLEKAYAKMVGAYENLDGGSTTEALIDMTGGIQETFDLKSMRSESQKKELWEVIIKSRKHKSLIGASIAPNPRVREARMSNGLVMGHAYTVTKIACIELGYREIKLIRLRNPWGNEVEWKGSFSDSSYEWKRISDEVKEELGYKNLPNGEFWMSYDDFYRFFETMQICELTPDAYSEELLEKEDNLEWKLAAYHGEWVPGESSGGCGRPNESDYWKNPQFLVNLPDVDHEDNESMATVVISLLQKYTREERLNSNGEPCEQYIQYRLYRILNDQDAQVAKKTGKYLYANQLERCGSTGAYINRREVTKRFKVAPGNYLIIPSCYDADVSGEFLLRIYTEKPVGTNACCELNKPKDNPTEEDLTFPKPNYLDALFRSWSSYFRTNTSYESKTSETVDDDKVNASNTSAQNNQENEDKCYVAPTRLYLNDAFVDLTSKTDIHRSKRFAKMFKTTLAMF